MHNVLQKALNESGKILMNHFSRLQGYEQKWDQSNIVTQADIKSEKRIISIIQEKFPDHNIIAEESGFVDKSSEYTWIIDPLDGTSNYAAGIPWFGSMIAILKNNEVVAAGINLPFYKNVYLAEKGKGAFRDGQKISVSAETDMKKVLICYSLDFSENIDQTKKEVLPLVQIVNQCRNTRSTNSIIDSCYAADGRVGAYVFRTAKVWDVAAPSLIISEAGGAASECDGRPFDFKTDKDNYLRNYSMVGGAKAFHEKLIEMMDNI